MTEAEQYFDDTIAAGAVMPYPEDVDFYVALSSIARERGATAMRAAMQNARMRIPAIAAAVRGLPGASPASAKVFSNVRSGHVLMPRGLGRSVAQVLGCPPLALMPHYDVFPWLSGRFRASLAGKSWSELSILLDPLSDPAAAAADADAEVLTVTPDESVESQADAVEPGRPAASSMPVLLQRPVVPLERAATLVRDSGCTGCDSYAEVCDCLSSGRGEEVSMPTDMDFPAPEGSVAFSSETDLEDVIPSEPVDTTPIDESMERIRSIINIASLSVPPMRVQAALLSMPPHRGFDAPVPLSKMVPFRGEDEPRVFEAYDPIVQSSSEPELEGVPKSVVHQFASVPVTVVPDHGDTVLMSLEQVGPHVRFRYRGAMCDRRLRMVVAAVTKAVVPDGATSVIQPRTVPGVSGRILICDALLLPDLAPSILVALGAPLRRGTLSRLFGRS